MTVIDVPGQDGMRRRRYQLNMLAEKKLDGINIVGIVDAAIFGRGV